MTHDGEILRLYLDGVIVGSMIVAGSIDTDTTLGVAIGAQPAGAGGSTG